MVTVMAAGGIEHRVIAIALNISRTTMWKHYRTEITSGAAKANANVIAALYRHATGPDARAAVMAAKWWTQARMNWTEKHEFTGADGTPLNPAQQTYVVRMPTPVESAEQWFRQYAPGGPEPKTIEGEKT